MTDDAIELAGIVIPLGDHLTPAIRRELKAGEYEQAELAAVRALLESDDIVMEIGTGLGFLSACCARVVGSDRVFTFEANPALERPIHDLYALNDVSPQLEICVLAESAGSAAFYLQREFWASSAVAGIGTARIRVPARSFEEVRAAIGPTLLIVDIEGGELELVRHARFDGVERVLIELHPEVIGEEGCEAVAARLADAGFAIQPGEWGSDTIFTFQRTADPASPAEPLVRDALAELPWHRAERALRVLLDTVPPGGAFVLLDESMWRGDEFGDRRRQFLVERAGEGFGLPELGAAVAELIARREEGARWLVVAWPAFWFFDTYPELLRHVEALPEIVRTRDIRIWELP